MLAFLTSYCERRNQCMNFQSSEFGSVVGKKHVNTSYCGVFELAVAMEIATMEIAFDSLSTIDLSHPDYTSVSQP